MIIGIKNQLEDIKNDLRFGTPIEEIPIKGTIAAIEGVMDFAKTDGFIQFTRLALDYIPDAYGTQNPEWQICIDKLCDRIIRLQDSNTRFTGDTPKEFSEYCNKLSHVMDADTSNNLEPLSFDIFTGDDLVPFLEKHAEKGNSRGFYYEETSDIKQLLMHDLMNQMSKIKFDKGMREHDISQFLTMRHYHEHVHDALNMLMLEAVYIINCSSTHKQKAYDYDIQHVQHEIEYAENIMSRVKYLV